MTAKELAGALVISVVVVGAAVLAQRDGGDPAPAATAKLSRAVRQEATAADVKDVQFIRGKTYATVAMRPTAERATLSPAPVKYEGVSAEDLRLGNDLVTRNVLAWLKTFEPIKSNPDIYKPRAEHLDSMTISMEDGVPFLSVRSTIPPEPGFEGEAPATPSPTRRLTAEETAWVRGMVGDVVVPVVNEQALEPK